MRTAIKVFVLGWGLALASGGPAAATGGQTPQPPGAGPQKPPSDRLMKSAPPSFQPPPLQPLGSTHQKTPLSGETAPTGDNAAYEAFDQGKYLTALRLAEEAAKKDDPEAHMLAGRIHLNGLGVPKNEILAAQWFRRGAELGNVDAMFTFGVMLAEGQGIAKNRAGAAQMFEAAAAKGHVVSNYNLGLLFLTGDGKPENPHRARAHLQYAAQQGLPQAQYDLGTLFATGAGTDETGVKANALDAAFWMSKAAAAGHGEAQFDYAIMLLQGRGLVQDELKSVEYLTAAAEKNIVVAQNRLARLYAYGLKVPADMIIAARWHRIAQAGGLQDAALDGLVAKMSRADRAKAEAATQAWLERAQVEGRRGN